MTGFINARFDILMNGTNTGANSDYRWEVSERWLSIDENGRILFERKPAENESRMVSVKATHKQNGEIWTWSFTVETWFTGYNSQQLIWEAARDYCNAQGLRLEERTELTTGTNIRTPGTLFSEWGSPTGYTYSGFMSSISYSWTSSPERNGFYYQVLLSNGATTSNSTD